MYKEKKILPNGREILIYSEEDIQKRKNKKKKRTNTIEKSISDIIETVSTDMKTNDDALVVAVILCTYERVGNEGSAKTGHYGASNLLRKHIYKSSPEYVELRYMAKSGVDQTKPIHEPNLCKILHARSRKGQDDRLFNTTPQRVNDYLSQFGITSKDIRTYAANKFMEDATRGLNPKTEAEKKKSFLLALNSVSSVIGHKPATLRSMYLHDSTKEKILGVKKWEGQKEVKTSRPARSSQR